MSSIKKLLSKQSGLFGPRGKNMEKETYRMMVCNLEMVKHSSPSRAPPHPKLCGRSLQVHSALPGKATAHLGLLSGPAEIPCVCQSSHWQWDWGATASICRVCQAGAGPCCHMRNERGSPIPDLLPAVGFTQLHNGGKTAASTRQQDKRFYKEVSVWEMPAALRYCRQGKQGTQSWLSWKVLHQGLSQPFYSP